MEFRTSRGIIVRVYVAKGWSAYLTAFILDLEAVCKGDFSSKTYEYWLVVRYTKPIKSLRSGLVPK